MGQRGWPSKLVYIAKKAPTKVGKKTEMALKRFVQDRRNDKELGLQVRQCSVRNIPTADKRTSL